MNSSPSAFTRTPLHTRAVTYRGFSRSDGLWDIEGRLVDTKDYAYERFEGGRLEPGLPAHHMFVRLTVDDALKIVNIETDMLATPFGECLKVAEPMRRLIGATLGQGWRKTIDATVGSVAGCTHLRELLFNMATAAIQTIPPYLHHQRRERGEAPTQDAQAPLYIGQCLSWRRDGPVVQRVYPQFFITRPKSEPAP